MDEKTFTQEEVNKIVSKRLSEERAKLEKEFAAKELNFNARAILKEKGLNPDLADVLKYEDEETLNKSIELLGESNPVMNKRGLVYEPRNGEISNIKPDSIRSSFGLPQGRNYGEEYNQKGWIDNLNLSTVFQGGMTHEESMKNHAAIEAKYKSWIGGKK